MGALCLAVIFMCYIFAACVVANWPKKEEKPMKLIPMGYWKHHLRMFVFATILLMSTISFAGETSDSKITPSTMWSTIRGKNELCPSVVEFYVAKTWHTKEKVGFDLRWKIGYQGWVRSLTQENEVKTSFGIEL